MAATERFMTLMSAASLRRSQDGGTSTVIIPFGSVEHHGAHLPLGADAILAEEAAAQVADSVGALVTPTVSIGCSEQHTHLAGTLTLRPGTLIDIATDYVHGLARQGFSLIILLSGHGGNVPALDAAATRLATELPTVMTSVPRGDVGPDAGSYSGVWLTSVMLALRPDLVDLTAVDPELAAEVQAANASRGRLDLERFVRSIIDHVRRLS